MTNKHQTKIDFIKLNPNLTAVEMATALRCTVAHVFNICSVHRLDYKSAPLAYHRPGGRMKVKRDKVKQPANCFNVDAYAKSGY